MLDICKNESDQNRSFDHIWIDSGTGFTAAVLCLMNELLGRKTQIHVVLTAGDPDFFEQKLREVGTWWEELTQIPLPNGFIRLPTLYPPATARSFGSVNQQVLKTVKDLAMTEGLLVDPVYTAKLFYTAKTHYFYPIIK